MLAADVLDLAVRRLGPAGNAEDALALVSAQLRAWGESRARPAEVHRNLAALLAVLRRTRRDAPAGDLLDALEELR